MTTGRTSFYASSNTSRAATGSAGPGTGFGGPDNRRSSRILVGDPIDPFMLVLHSIIALATDIIDMPLSLLTTSPNACSDLVQRVQTIGQAWDEHPDWHGRAWYVQLLLSVAGLSRVVEWWEAEKQFWNLDDESEDGTPGGVVVDDGNEPLIFVMKAAGSEKEGGLHGVSSGYLSGKEGSRSSASLPDRRSRDEQQKPLETRESTPSPEARDSDQSSVEGDAQQESAKLQEEVDRAQIMNIVMELSLDGEHLIWVNDAWRIVVG
jgi:serine/threonine-protein kinase RIM15